MRKRTVGENTGKSMELNICRLNSILSKYTEIVLYGCGEIAIDVYTELLRIGRIPQFCVVSDKSKGINPFFDGKLAVYEIEEKEAEIRRENILIILAVNSFNAQTIRNLLDNMGINNYITILEYDRCNYTYLQEREGMSEDVWLREIAEWYIDSVQDYTLDVEKEIQRINRFRSKVEKKKVVFVVGDLTPRTVKIAKALKGMGYQLEIYAYPNAYLRASCFDELMQLQIIFIQCKTMLELLHCLIVAQSEVIHIFTHSECSYYDRIVIQLKGILPPMVYDEYDITGAFYTNASQQVVDDEKYCLENADGICNRGFEIEYLKQGCNYCISAPNIQFSDYCNEIQYNKAERLSELSFCYVGGIVSQREYPDFFENFKNFAKMCKVNNCHFHIYPVVFDEQRHVEYRELEKQNEYFHLHMPVPFGKLALEIAQYDYGIFPISKKALNGAGYVYNTHEKLIYGFTNKYFDYLDAGLPIIAATSLRQVQFFKERNVILDWTIEDYDFNELRRRKQELKENVLIEREKLKISNHIEELIDLYTFISKNKRRDR